MFLNCLTSNEVRALLVNWWRDLPFDISTIEELLVEFGSRIVNKQKAKVRETNSLLEVNGNSLLEVNGNSRREDEGHKIKRLRKRDFLSLRSSLLPGYFILMDAFSVSSAWESIEVVFNEEREIWPLVKCGGQQWGILDNGRKPDPIRLFFS
ncbi:hypothetical protein L6452_03319 [Arctium lappa]|uniref:Uncharacterized protein n=1 Tax=Arctium lappa TaxID=4217 RepID=A0ACB9FMW7_ARCLA|nr:hypothetical protein L6452_03319 [Arctium lappa]